MSSNEPHKAFVESVAQNTIITALARLASLLFVPVSVGFFSFVLGLQEAQTKAESRIQLLEQSIAQQVITYTTLQQQLKELDSRTIIILQSVARLEAKTEVGRSSPSSVPPTVSQP